MHSPTVASRPADIAQGWPDRAPFFVPSADVGAYRDSLDLREVRCKRCNKLLAKANLAAGSALQIKCPRCRSSADAITTVIVLDCPPDTM
jgi:phage FluMu protein Com